MMDIQIPNPPPHILCCCENRLATLTYMLPYGPYPPHYNGGCRARRRGWGAVMAACLQPVTVRYAAIYYAPSWLMQVPHNDEHTHSHARTHTQIRHLDAH